MWVDSTSAAVESRPACRPGLRDDLIRRRISKAAAKAGVTLVLVREGGKHSIYRCGSQPVSVPRHREINEMTARGIIRDLEGELGSGWWQR